MGRLRHDGTAEEWARGEPFNQPVANHTVATHTVANHTCVRCAHPGDKDFLDDLPFKLRAELSMSMHQEMVSRVPFFQDAEEKFISDLVVRLTPQIHMPGDTIIIEGEPGDRMFFVSSGQVGCCTRLQVPPQQLQSSWPGRLLIASTGGGGSDESSLTLQVEIVNRDDLVLKVIGRGDYLGELALLSDEPRAASAVARTFCELQVHQNLPAHPARSRCTETAVTPERKNTGTRKSSKRSTAQHSAASSAVDVANAADGKIQWT